MTKSHVMRPLARANAFVAAAVIAASAIVPAVLLNGMASGAQLNNRSIDLSANQTSEGSGREGDTAGGLGDDVTYQVSFDLNSAHGDLEGIVIDFCSNSPIVGLACTAPTGFNVDAANLGFVEDGATNGTTDQLNANWAVDTVNSDANTVILTDTVSTGDTFTGGETLTFDLGTSAADDGITNPSDPGTFYARIITYTDDTVADDYAPTAEGAYTDDGGIAMAITNELTVSARVQEVLQFCVGTDDSGALDECSDITGTDIDLGVVDTDVSVSATNAGLAMIRTNALNGAAVYYKAEQDTGSGKLKQVGATCSGVLQTDACFNSAIGSGTASAPVSNTIDDGVEEFGMTVTEVNTTNGGATTNLARDPAYDGNGAANGTCTAADANADEECWAWADAGSFDTIASSGSVIDDEMLELAFAATAAATTPTGLYTVTANFVATSTF